MIITFNIGYTEGYIMLKLFMLIFLVSFAHAEDSSILGNVYQEAILFFTLFGIMSILSFLVSRKNAREYEREHPLEERKAIVRERELVDLFLNSSYIKIKGKAIILLELSQLLEDRAINQEEFKILKHKLCVGSRF